MYKVYVGIFFLLLQKTVIAQLPTLQWAKAFHADGTAYYIDYSNGRTVAVDQQGNVYSAGIFNHSVDFDPGPGVFTLTDSALGTGIYISKLGPNGDFIWAKKLDITVEFGFVEMKVDKSGNLYLTSYFGAPTDMDPGPGVQMYTPIGAKDAFVIKLDTNGNLVWVKQFGGSGDTVPYGSALEIDPFGNIIVCGSFNRTVDFDPGPNTFNLTATGNFEAFITKLTNNGDFIWAKKFGNYKNRYPSIGVYDVKCDPLGNVYTTGIFSDECDFDPSDNNYYLMADGGANAYIAELDAGGNFVWAKKIGTSFNNTIFDSRAIDIDSKNNIYTTGTFTGTQDFDPGAGVYNLSSIDDTYDTYVLKLTAKGDFVWVRGIGSNSTFDTGTDLVVDKDDNVYVSGDFSANISIYPGSATVTIPGKYGANAVTKFSAAGDFIYSAMFPDYDLSGAFFRRMAIDTSKNIYIAGSVSSPTDFDPGPNVYTLSGSAAESPFVLKLSKCSNPTTATLNVHSCGSYTLNNATFDSSGTYIQTLPNAKGCDSIITLNLTITKKTTQQTKAICKGDSLFIGGANQTIAGTYYDTLQTSLGCDSIVATHLTINPVPVPNLGPDKNLCSNHQLTVTPGIFSSYLWQDGSTSASYNIATSGLFWVTVSNGLNCFASDSININAVFPNPSNFLHHIDSICPFEKLLIQPLANFSSYLWSTGEVQSSITVTAPGQYWLTATDENGCVGTDTATVYPKECIAAIFFPTAFTPNGDGNNDQLKPKLFGNVIKYMFCVYNRWGQLVFQSSDSQIGWDGNTNGVKADGNTFVWTCVYQFQGRVQEFKKGTVVLIR